MHYNIVSKQLYRSFLKCLINVLTCNDTRDIATLCQSFLEALCNVFTITSSGVLNSRPFTLQTTCLTCLPIQHYVFMFWVLFFWVVYYAPQINKIVSLVNQKMPVEMSLQDIAILKISQNCIYILTLYKMPPRMSLQSLWHFVFKTRSIASQKDDSIAYIGAK
jgi:hypothetical protein